MEGPVPVPGRQLTLVPRVCKPLLVAAIVLVSSSCRRAVPPSPLHFAREEIQMDVMAGEVEIRGMYHFTCASPEPLVAQLFYPFPIDSTSGYPDSISIPGHSYSRADSGVALKMRFAPAGEDSFFVYYRQRLSAKRAVYIVTTTRRWQRPIDMAGFRVTVPAAFRDVELTYRPDSVSHTGSATTYFFARRRFYPTEDVVVSWR